MWQVMYAVLTILGLGLGIALLGLFVAWFTSWLFDRSKDL